MTLRDDLIAVLGPGNDDPAAEAQADSVLDVLHQHDLRPSRLDLNDPETENLVADAIARLAPDGAYVALSDRYPWRFTTHAGNPQQGVSILDAVVEALRASATVHEAAGIPDLVPALTALADVLERGALVPGPPPGRCGDPCPFPSSTASCELLAGHAGLHEGDDWAAMPPGVLGEVPRMHWGTPATGSKQ